MNRNIIGVLVVAAVLASALAWLVGGTKSSSDGADGAQSTLVPGLSAALNDVTGIAVVSADGTPAVTLTRGDRAWQVGERGGYPADTGKVRKYLLDLADATLVEAKTTRPENYPALGVVTPGEDGASGTQVTVEGVADAQAFVVGNAARGGSYVRRVDEAQSWLSDTDVSVDSEPTDWLDRRVMDVDPADIVAVEIRHPDGEVVSARRGEVNLQLDVLPEGKVPTGPAALNPLADLLRGLQLDDVEPASAFDSEGLEPVVTRWTTRDGVVIEARLYEGDDSRRVTFAARVAPPAEADAAADAPADEADADAAAQGAESTAGDAAGDAGSAEALARAEEIAARTAGWVYRLPSARVAQMTRRNDDFLRDADPE